MVKINRTVVVTVTIIACSVIIGLVLQSSMDQPGSPEGDDFHIRHTIIAAWQIRLEAEYTYDTSQFSTVYVNDPRGGGITDEALQQIREFRQDPMLQKDQVGILDYEIMVIERTKQNYDSYMAELRAKQAAGSLTAEESLILFGETHGWPTATPEMINLAQYATQACEAWLTQAANPRETATPMSSPEYTGDNAAYPYPEPRLILPTHAPLKMGTPYPPPGDQADQAGGIQTPATSAAQPGIPYPLPRDLVDNPGGVLCPTPYPTSLPIKVPFRGANPATLPQDELKIEFLSVEINGDIARAVVHQDSVTTEYTLVKIDGHWFIAGAKLVKGEF